VSEVGVGASFGTLTQRGGIGLPDYANPAYTLCFYNPPAGTVCDRNKRIKTFLLYYKKKGIEKGNPFMKERFQVAN